MPRIIVFDLDDTLYPEQQYVQSGFRAVDRFLSLRSIDGFFTIAWEYFKSGGRNNTFNYTLAQLDVEFDDAMIDSLVEVYRSHEPAIRLSDSVTQVLMKLRADFSLAIITDGPALSQKRKIEALGIASIFRKIVVTDELGPDRRHWKPDPRPYQEVADFFDVKHSDCTYIGDNPAKDFVTAKRLGWETIHFPKYRNYCADKEHAEEYQADFYIYSLHELVDRYQPEEKHS